MIPAKTQMDYEEKLNKIRQTKVKDLTLIQLLELMEEHGDCVYDKRQSERIRLITKIHEDSVTIRDQGDALHAKSDGGKE